MLYGKKNAETLDPALFKDPTSEYRGTPFWAWNCKLDADELHRQQEIFKEMGFGGAHMHVRSGMATPYLSDEYMELIKGCVEKAKSMDMLAYLYDEDRWPSGAAGGLVTKDVENRARYLLFTHEPYGKSGNKEKVEVSQAKGGRAENGRLIACFDVELDADGYLKSYQLIDEKNPAVHDKWYAYLEISTESGWYNNQTYVNTLDKKAMDRFIEITYESYNRTIAEDFGKAVPSIFTDEPQFTRKSTLRFATDKKDVTLPWTDDLPETYEKAYGEDLLTGIPELIWDRADRVPSVIRYHYHDHVCERFTEAFADNCGAWCRAHGLALTGHMMEEPTLESQTAALGEAMRAYRGFDLPGIDMLCAYTEYTTAKQTQSAVHQFGYEGMLSELYGVTNWDFDFRGHKLHGDWQAALGVTVRVPHLSWVSMAGEAKRDYPASISYQSPWWKEYSRVENHFARVNTAMVRGTAAVRVGMIHPVESYWLHWGPAEQTALVRKELDQNFQNMTKWLLFGGIDFDFISESLLPSLCEEGGAPLKVGKMAYDVVIVPGCETLCSTTLERLEAFRKAGGKLIFAGSIPTLENAVRSGRGAALAAQSDCVTMSRGSVLSALDAFRSVEIRDESGAYTENLLHQLRRDGDTEWLFIAHGVEPYNKDISRFQDLKIRVAGKWAAEVYDTMTGEIRKIRAEKKNGCTEILYRMYDYDSLLLHLTPAETAENDIACETDERAVGGAKQIALPKTFRYSLSEPNALLLDQAEYALDDGDWQPEEEILRLDNNCREALSWPSRKESFAQPWVVPEEPLTHTVHLKWHIFSEIEVTGAHLAIEDGERVVIRLNGETVPSDVDGWYTDKSIKTIALPAIHPGENVLEADIPFGRRTNVEWAYLTGMFGVRASGREAVITKLPETLTFGDITRQGLPFYGGNVTYHLPVTTAGGDVMLRSGRYRGALQTASMDSGKAEAVIFPPYRTQFTEVPAGEHIIDLTLFGHRRNSFGPVHLADLCDKWIGPNAWRSEGDKWCYDYVLCEEGILAEPEITEIL